MNHNKKKRSVVSYLNPEVGLDLRPTSFGYYDISWEELLQSEVVLSPKSLSSRADSERLSNLNGRSSAQRVRCQKCSIDENDPKEQNNEHMIWVHYRSDERSWMCLAGREGFMLICTKHNKRIFFVVTVMS